MLALIDEPDWLKNGAIQGSTAVMALWFLRRLNAEQDSLLALMELPLTERLNDRAASHGLALCINDNGLAPVRLGAYMRSYNYEITRYLDDEELSGRISQFRFLESQDLDPAGQSDRPYFEEVTRLINLRGGELLLPMRAAGMFLRFWDMHVYEQIAIDEASGRSWDGTDLYFGERQYLAECALRRKQLALLSAQLPESLTSCLPEELRCDEAEPVSPEDEATCKALFTSVAPHSLFIYRNEAQLNLLRYQSHYESNLEYARDRARANIRHCGAAFASRNLVTSWRPEADSQGMFPGYNFLHSTGGIVQASDPDSQYALSFTDVGPLYLSSAAAESEIRARAARADNTMAQDVASAVADAMADADDIGLGASDGKGAQDGAIWNSQLLGDDIDPEVAASLNSLHSASVDSDDDPVLHDYMQDMLLDVDEVAGAGRQLPADIIIEDNSDNMDRLDLDAEVNSDLATDPEAQGYARQPGDVDAAAAARAAAESAADRHCAGAVAGTGSDLDEEVEEDDPLGDLIDGAIGVMGGAMGDVFTGAADATGHASLAVAMTESSQVTAAAAQESEGSSQKAPTSADGAVVDMSDPVSMGGAIGIMGGAIGDFCVSTADAMGDGSSQGSVEGAQAGMQPGLETGMQAGDSGEPYQGSLLDSPEDMAAQASLLADASAADPGMADDLEDFNDDLDEDLSDEDLAASLVIPDDMEAAAAAAVKSASGLDELEEVDAAIVDGIDTGIRSDSMGAAEHGAALTSAMAGDMVASAMDRQLADGDLADSIVAGDLDDHSGISFSLADGAIAAGVGIDGFEDTGMAAAGIYEYSVSPAARSRRDQSAQLQDQILADTMAPSAVADTGSARADGVEDQVFDEADAVFDTPLPDDGFDADELDAGAYGTDGMKDREVREAIIAELDDAQSAADAYASEGYADEPYAADDYQDKAGEAGAYEAGSYQDDAGEAGAYEACSYQDEAGEAGAYEAGSYQGDAGEAGAYEDRSYQGDAGETVACEDGSYGDEAYAEQPYGSQSDEPELYEAEPVEAEMIELDSIDVNGYREVPLHVTVRHDETRSFEAGDADSLDDAYSRAVAAAAAAGDMVSGGSGMGGYAAFKGMVARGIIFWRMPLERRISGSWMREPLSDFYRSVRFALNRYQDSYPYFFNSGRSSEQLASAFLQRFFMDGQNTPLRCFISNITLDNTVESRFYLSIRIPLHPFFDRVDEGAALCVVGSCPLDKSSPVFLPSRASISFGGDDRADWELECFIRFTLLAQGCAPQGDLPDVSLEPFEEALAATPDLANPPRRRNRGGAAGASASGRALVISAGLADAAGAAGTAGSAAAAGTAGAEAASVAVDSAADKGSDVSGTGRMGNVLAAACMRVIPPFAAHTARRLRDWEDFLYFKEALVKHRSQGLRYFSWSYNEDSGCLEFLVAASDNDDLRSTIRSFRRQNLHAYNLRSSADPYVFRLPPQLNDRQSFSVEIDFDDIGQINSSATEIISESSAHAFMMEQCQSLRERMARRIEDENRRISRRRGDKDADEGISSLDPHSAVFALVSVELSEELSYAIGRLSALNSKGAASKSGKADRNGSASQAGGEGGAADADAAISAGIASVLRDLPKEGFLALSIVGDLALIARHRSAVRSLKTNEGCYAPYLSSYLFDIKGAHQPEVIEPVTRWFNTELNNNQKLAVRKMLAAPNICLIQGPPGTGKTTVIAEACAQFARRNQRVLLASQSHDALDNALARLENHPHLRALRLAGNIKRITPSGREFTGPEVLVRQYRALADHAGQLCDENSSLRQSLSAAAAMMLSREADRLRGGQGADLSGCVVLENYASDQSYHSYGSTDLPLLDIKYEIFGGSEEEMISWYDCIDEDVVSSFEFAQFDDYSDEFGNDDKGSAQEAVAAELAERAQQAQRAVLPKTQDERSAEAEAVYEYAQGLAKLFEDDSDPYALDESAHTIAQLLDTDSIDEDQESDPLNHNTIAPEDDDNAAAARVDEIEQDLQDVVDRLAASSMPALIAMCERIDADSNSQGAARAELESMGVDFSTSTTVEGKSYDFVDSVYSCLKKHCRLRLPGLEQAVAEADEISAILHQTDPFSDGGFDLALRIVMLGMTGYGMPLVTSEMLGFTQQLEKAAVADMRRLTVADQLPLLTGCRNITTALNEVPSFAQKEIAELNTDLEHATPDLTGLKRPVGRLSARLRRLVLKAVRIGPLARALNTSGCSSFEAADELRQSLENVVGRLDLALEHAGSWLEELARPCELISAMDSAVLSMGPGFTGSALRPEGDAVHVSSISADTDIHAVAASASMAASDLAHGASLMAGTTAAAGSAGRAAASAAAAADTAASGAATASAAAAADAADASGAGAAGAGAGAESGQLSESVDEAMQQLGDFYPFGNDFVAAFDRYIASVRSESFEDRMEGLFAFVEAVKAIPDFERRREYFRSVRGETDSVDYQSMIKSLMEHIKQVRASVVDMIALLDSDSKEADLSALSAMGIAQRDLRDAAASADYEELFDEDDLNELRLIFKSLVHNPAVTLRDTEDAQISDKELILLKDMQFYIEHSEITKAERLNCARRLARELMEREGIEMDDKLVDDVLEEVNYVSQKHPAVARALGKSVISAAKNETVQQPASASEAAAAASGAKSASGASASAGTAAAAAAAVSAGAGTDAGKAAMAGSVASAATSWVGASADCVEKRQKEILSQLDEIIDWIVDNAQPMMKLQNAEERAYKAADALASRKTPATLMNTHAEACFRAQVEFDTVEPFAFMVKNICSMASIMASDLSSLSGTNRIGPRMLSTVNESDELQRIFHCVNMEWNSRDADIVEKLAGLSRKLEEVRKKIRELLSSTDFKIGELSMMDPELVREFCQTFMSARNFLCFSPLIAFDPDNYEERFNKVLDIYDKVARSFEEGDIPTKLMGFYIPDEFDIQAVTSAITGTILNMVSHEESTGFEALNLLRTLSHISSLDDAGIFKVDYNAEKSSSEDDNESYLHYQSVTMVDARDNRDGVFRQRHAVIKKLVRKSLVDMLKNTAVFNNWLLEPVCPEYDLSSDNSAQLFNVISIMSSFTQLMSVMFRFCFEMNRYDESKKQDQDIELNLSQSDAELMDRLAVRAEQLRVLIDCCAGADDLIMRPEDSSEDLADKAQSQPAKSGRLRRGARKNKAKIEAENARAQAQRQEDIKKQQDRIKKALDYAAEHRGCTAIFAPVGKIAQSADGLVSTAHNFAVFESKLDALFGPLDDDLRQAALEQTRGSLTRDLSSELSDVDKGLIKSFVKHFNANIENDSMHCNMSFTGTRLGDVHDLYVSGLMHQEFVRRSGTVLAAGSFVPTAMSAEARAAADIDLSAVSEEARAKAWAEHKARISDLEEVVKSTVSASFAAYSAEDATQEDKKAAYAAVNAANQELEYAESRITVKLTRADLCAVYARIVAIMISLRAKAAGSSDLDLSCLALYPMATGHRIAACCDLSKLRGLYRDICELRPLFRSKFGEFINKNIKTYNDLTTDARNQKVENQGTTELVRGPKGPMEFIDTGCNYFNTMAECHEILEKAVDFGNTVAGEEFFTLGSIMADVDLNVRRTLNAGHPVLEGTMDDELEDLIPRDTHSKGLSLLSPPEKPEYLLLPYSMLEVADDPDHREEVKAQLEKSRKQFTSRYSNAFDSSMKYLYDKYKDFYKVALLSRTIVNDMRRITEEDLLPEVYHHLMKLSWADNVRLASARVELCPCQETIEMFWACVCTEPGELEFRFDDAAALAEKYGMPQGIYRFFQILKKHEFETLPDVEQVSSSGLIPLQVGHNGVMASMTNLLAELLESGYPENRLSSQNLKFIKKFADDFIDRFKEGNYSNPFTNKIDPRRLLKALANRPQMLKMLKIDLSEVDLDTDYRKLAPDADVKDASGEDHKQGHEQGHEQGSAGASASEAAASDAVPSDSSKDSSAGTDQQSAASDSASEAADEASGFEAGADGNSHDAGGTASAETESKSAASDNASQNITDKHDAHDNEEAQSELVTDVASGDIEPAVQAGAAIESDAAIQAGAAIESDAAIQAGAAIESDAAIQADAGVAADAGLESELRGEDSVDGDDVACAEDESDCDDLSSYSFSEEQILNGTVQVVPHERFVAYMTLKEALEYDHLYIHADANYIDDICIYEDLAAELGFNITFKESTASVTRVESLIAELGDEDRSHFTYAMSLLGRTLISHMQTSLQQISERLSGVEDGIRELGISLLTVCNDVITGYSGNAASRILSMRRCGFISELVRSTEQFFFSGMTMKDEIPSLAPALELARRRVQACDCAQPLPLSAHEQAVAKRAAAAAAEQARRRSSAGLAFAGAAASAAAAAGKGVRGGGVMAAGHAAGKAAATLAAETSPEALRLVASDGFGALASEWADILGNADGHARRDWDEVEAAYIQSCNVVAVSCNENERTLAAHDFDAFDVVIIDEVSKATPLELLLPLMRAPKAVLVGDHRQLPPIFNERDGMTFEDEVDRLENARNNASAGIAGEDEEGAFDESVAQLTRSNFERYENMVTASLFKELFEQAPESLRQRLDMQFRMHPEIMRLVNFFYDESLHCGNPERDRSHPVVLQDEAGHTLIGPDDHILWVDTTLNEQGKAYTIESNRNVNYVEAHLIAKTLIEMEHICTAAGYGPGRKLQVGVVSFYQPQCRAIREQITAMVGRNSNWFDALDVEINTVIRYQGKEKPVVILSLVKNNGGPFNQHFPAGRANVSRFEFINVAMSRAQNLLMVFGARNMYNNRDVRMPAMDRKGTETRQVYRAMFDYLELNSSSGRMTTAPAFTTVLGTANEIARENNVTAASRHGGHQTFYADAESRNRRRASGSHRNGAEQAHKVNEVTQVPSVWEEHARLEQSDQINTHESMDDSSVLKSDKYAQSQDRRSDRAGSYGQDRYDNSAQWRSANAFASSSDEDRAAPSAGATDRTDAGSSRNASSGVWQRSARSSTESSGGWNRGSTGGGSSAAGYTAGGSSAAGSRTGGYTAAGSKTGGYTAGGSSNGSSGGWSSGTGGKGVWNSSNSSNGGWNSGNSSNGGWSSGNSSNGGWSSGNSSNSSWSSGNNSGGWGNASWKRNSWGNTGWKRKNSNAGGWNSNSNSTGSGFNGNSNGAGPGGGWNSSSRNSWQDNRSSRSEGYNSSGFGRSSDSGDYRSGRDNETRGWNNSDELVYSSGNVEQSSLASQLASMLNTSLKPDLPPAVRGDEDTDSDVSNDRDVIGGDSSTRADAADSSARSGAGSSGTKASATRADGAQSSGAGSAADSDDSSGADTSGAGRGSTSGNLPDAPELIPPVAEDMSSQSDSDDEADGDDGESFAALLASEGFGQIRKQPQERSSATVYSTGKKATAAKGVAASKAGAASKDAVASKGGAGAQSGTAAKAARSESGSTGNSGSSKGVSAASLASLAEHFGGGKKGRK